MKLALIKRGDQLYLMLPDENRAVAHSEAREFVMDHESYITSSSFIDESSIEEKDELLVSLENDNKLIFHNLMFFSDLMFAHDFPYYTIEEYAQLHGRDTSLIRKLCRNGRLNGARQVGSAWLIPKDLPYPKDGRAGRDMSKRYAKKENR